MEVDINEVMNKFLYFQFDDVFPYKHLTPNMVKELQPSWSHLWMRRALVPILVDLEFEELRWVLCCSCCSFLGSHVLSPQRFSFSCSFPCFFIFIFNLCNGWLLRRPSYILIIIKIKVLPKLVLNMNVS